ncbi:hypothetical protein HA402_014544 [Bradysia odoriphaga]|nr:hypothetical protein HA402_014544 [Bradysia odoriphaga]
MRDKANYSQDLKMKNFEETGIREDAFVNSISLCHATINIGIDRMHDVFEGILHYNLCEVMLALIRDGYCSLDTLNKLKADLSYGEVEADAVRGAQSVQTGAHMPVINENDGNFEEDENESVIALDAAGANNNPVANETLDSGNK